MNAAREMLPFILKLKLLNSILDVGCGTGTWLAAAQELGVKDILGIDGVAVDVDTLKIHSDYFLNRNLDKEIDLERKFDAVICLEVAEHLGSDYAATLVTTLTKHSDIIIFSAAIPDQGGQNHLNEQWPAYWQELFAHKGYFPSEIIRDHFWENEKVEWWYRQNIILYAPLPVLDGLGLTKTSKVRSLVHPGLLREKISSINDLNETIKKEVWQPSVKSAFKRFIKALIPSG